MANLQFFGGNKIDAQDFQEELSRTSRKFMEYPWGKEWFIELKRVFDAVRVGIQGRPQYPPTDIGSLLSWHRRNELVFACIEKICQAAQDPELIVQEKKASEWQPVDGHPLRRLMMRPNPLDDAASFLRTWLSSKEIAGIFYAEIVFSKAGTPAQLWPLNPAKIVPIAGKGKDGSPIIGYQWKDQGQIIDLKPEQVLVDRHRDLTSHYHAISPLSVALGAVDADQAQTDYVRAFFNNGGVPSGLLTFKNRTLTRGEMEQKRQAWMLRYGRGGIGERGIAILDQNAEYQPIGTPIKELEADSLRGQAEARICMAFGVPPLLIGAYVGLKNVNQRASAREAQNDFWINKMSPTFKALRSFLTWTLLPYFVSEEKILTEQVRVNWDMSQVMALQEDEDKRHTRARANFQAGGLTRNEYRQQIGQVPDPKGDFYLIPRSYDPQTGEVTMSIAEQVPMQPPALAEGDNPASGGEDQDQADDEKSGFDALRTLMLSAKERWAVPATKIFELDGLRLAREPKTWESHLDLKAIAEGSKEQTKRITTALLDFRKKLIAQAADDLSDRDPQDLHSIVLTPNPRIYKTLRKQLDGAYKRGRALVEQEAIRALGGAPKSLVIYLEAKAQADIEEADDDFLDELSGTTVARVVNDVQSKASGILATLAVLRVLGSDRQKRIKETLEEGSTTYVEQSASAVANAALNLGRDAEIEARSSDIERVLYSAILDVSTCEQCEAADGQEADAIEDLPPAPNDECLGGDKCRCFHVAVFVTERSDE